MDVRRHIRQQRRGDGREVFSDPIYITRNLGYVEKKEPKVKITRSYRAIN